MDWGLNLVGSLVILLMSLAVHASDISEVNVGQIEEILAQQEIIKEILLLYVHSM